jgi:hypothetical protein
MKRSRLTKVIIASFATLIIILPLVGCDSKVTQPQENNAIDVSSNLERLYDVSFDLARYDEDENGNLTFYYRTRDDRNLLVSASYKYSGNGKSKDIVFEDSMKTSISQYCANQVFGEETTMVTESTADFTVEKIVECMALISETSQQYNIDTTVTANNPSFSQEFLMPDNGKTQFVFSTTNKSKLKEQLLQACKTNRQAC